MQQNTCWGRPPNVNFTISESPLGAAVVLISTLTKFDEYSVFIATVKFLSKPLQSDKSSQSYMNIAHHCKKSCDCGKTSKLCKNCTAQDRSFLVDLVIIQRLWKVLAGRGKFTAMQGGAGCANWAHLLGINCCELWLSILLNDMFDHYKNWPIYSILRNFFHSSFTKNWKSQITPNYS